MVGQMRLQALGRDNRVVLNPVSESIDSEITDPTSRDSGVTSVAVHGRSSGDSGRYICLAIYFCEMFLILRSLES